MFIVARTSLISFDKTPNRSRHLSGFPIFTGGLTTILPSISNSLWFARTWEPELEASEAQFIVQATVEGCVGWSSSE